MSRSITDVGGVTLQDSDSDIDEGDDGVETTSDDDVGGDSESLSEYGAFATDGVNDNYEGQGEHLASYAEGDKYLTTAAFDGESSRRPMSAS
eukprot:COSAG05_NODE_10292_length_573_cov_1.162447_2_plen_91_part_01